MAWNVTYGNVFVSRKHRYAIIMRSNETYGMRENQNEKEERKSVVKRGTKSERERKMQNEKDGMIRK